MGRMRSVLHLANKEDLDVLMTISDILNKGNLDPSRIELSEDDREKLIKAGVTIPQYLLEKEEEEEDFPTTINRPCIIEDDFGLPPTMATSGFSFISKEERDQLLHDTIHPFSRTEERELKKVRRRIKNKLSAQESRRRKKDYIDGLEDRFKEKSRENNELSDKLEKAEDRLRSLVDELFELKQHPEIAKILHTQPTLPRKPTQLSRATQTGMCLQCYLGQTSHTYDYYNYQDSPPFSGESSRSPAHGSPASSPLSPSLQNMPELQLINVDESSPKHTDISSKHRTETKFESRSRCSSTSTSMDSQDDSLCFQESDPFPLESMEVFPPQKHTEGSLKYAAKTNHRSSSVSLITKNFQEYQGNNTFSLKQQLFYKDNLSERRNTKSV